jgi:hypothetical protein
MLRVGSPFPLQHSSVIEHFLIMRGQRVASGGLVKVEELLVANFSGYRSF